MKTENFYTKVADRTMLAVLSQSCWRATVLHRTETAAENQRHQTEDARVLVRLTRHPVLKELHTLHSAAYAEHVRLTLPSLQDGIRMLPVENQLKHAAAMDRFRKNHDMLVAEFLADYQRERDEAPERLNTLYDESAWPQLEDLSQKFGFSIRYLTCPKDAQWQAWVQDSVEGAIQELRERITETLNRVVTRCSTEGRLHESVFDAVRQLVEAVPSLNLTEDPAIAKVVMEAEQKLSWVYAPNIRNDADKRQEVAKVAADILAQFGR